MPIESDQPNADGQLQVSFYTYEGEGMFKGVPHVRIISPGDKLNIPDRPASEYDKQRFQRQLLFYQQGSSKDQIIGTPLQQWRAERPEEVSDGQLQELMILKFMTVEQVAMASDTQVQRVGMGAQGLRERARSYLSSKNAQASGAELQNAKAEIAAMKEQMAALMVAMQGQAKPVAEAESKQKPLSGWKRAQMAKLAKQQKKEKRADVEHDAPASAAGL